MRKKFIFLLFAFLTLAWQGNAQVTIGTGTEVGRQLPVEPYYGYSYSQVIYLASEISASGDITELTWDFAGANLDNSNEWTIYMGHTSKTEFANDTDWIDVNTLTQVFSGTVSVDANNKVIVDITDFTYNGTDNLVIAVDENKDGYNGSSDDFYTTAVTGDRAIEYHNDNTNPDPASPPSGNIKAFIANIVLGGIQQACPSPTDLAIANLTDTSVDLSWTDNTSGNASYIVEWRETGASSWNSATTATGATSYQVTGLTAHTEYEWQITADCGSEGTSSTTVGANFYTACDAVTSFPYTYGFEDLTSNTNADWSVSCWGANPENQGSDTYSGPYRWNPYDDATPSGSTGPNGPRSGSIYAYTEASGSSEGDVAELISPLFDMSSLTTPQITFYYYMYGADMGSLHLDTYDGNTWTNDVWSVSGEQQTSDSEDWLKASVIVSNTVTQFRIRSIRGADYTSDMAVDAIAVNEAPACMEPTDLFVSDITATSARLNWTDNNNGNSTYTVEWREVGAATWNSDTTTDNIYDVTGLTGLTDYEWQVTADCGSNGLSSTASGPNFSTPCGIYVPDYLEDFANMSSSSVPDCWEEGKGPETGPTSTGASYWTADGFANNGTTGSAKINLYNTTREDWLISPHFDLSAADYQLEFDVAVTHYGNTDPSPMGSDDQVKLFVSTDGGTTWTAMETWDVNNTPSNTGEHKIYDLSSYNNQTDVQFAFWATDGSTDDPEDLDFFVDNFQIRIPPTCPDPSNLTVANITSDSADLGWTDNAGANMYNIELGVTGFSPTGTPTYSGVTSPYTASNLTPQTTYDFYVQADCGNGDTSNWVGPFTFTTTPVNDVCMNAIPLTVDTSCNFTTFSNVGATDSGAGSPGCGGYQGGDIWFSVVVPATGHLKFDSNTGDITDGAMAIYSGDCANLTLIECDDDDSDNGRMPMIERADLTPGETIYIRFWEFYNNTFGTFDICVQELPRDCSIAITPPYLEAFDSYLPDCWQEGDQAPNGQDGNWTEDGFGNIGTTGAARVDIYAGNDRDWLITPTFDLSAGDYVLSVDVAVSHWKYAQPETMSDDDEVVLKYSEDGGQTWNDLYTWNKANQPDNLGRTDIIDLANITSASTKFAFWANEGGDDRHSVMFFIDNFMIKSGISCDAPTDLLVDITGTSYYPTWTDNSGGTAVYTLQWRPALTSAWNSVELPAGSTNYELTSADLVSGTEYEWRVLYTCDSSPGLPVEGPNFIYGCDVIIPDYLQDFSNFAPDCWRESNDSPGTPMNYNDSGWASRPFARSGSNPSASINMYAGNDRDWLISPQFDLSAGNYELSVDVAVTFWQYQGPVTMPADDKIVLKYSDDLGNTWNDIVVWDVNNQPSYTGETFTYNLSNIVGTNVMFAFYADEGTDQRVSYLFYADNFSIHTVSAPRPAGDNLNVDLAQQDEKFTLTSMHENDRINSIYVYDISGRLLYRNDEVNSLEQEVWLNVPSGTVLIFHIGMDNGEKVIKKAIKL